MKGISITVPASTANLGPGFDSVGMALDKYLTLYIEPASKWEFEHQSVHLPSAPSPEEHLIYQSAIQVSEAVGIPLPPAKVIVHSDIPLARGLGSSASAVVAGIEMANQLCHLSLTNEEKLNFATKIEGHPDNAAASIYGGLVISAQIADNQIEMIKHVDQQLEVVVYIPAFELKTADARKVLPDHFLRKDAATASAISNVMIAAFLTENYSLAGTMMENDLFHEPYRADLITNYEKIRQRAREFGAYGTVISGAGPTMLSLVPKTAGQTILSEMQRLLPDYNVEVLAIDQQGIQVKTGTYSQD